MSVSIMDAYRARITDMAAFTKFIGDITTAYKYFLLEAYAEHVEETIIKLTERMPYLKYAYPERYQKLYKRFETKALQAYAKMMARKRNSENPVYPDMDFDAMLHGLPVIDVAKAVAYKSLNVEQTTAKLYICPAGKHVLIKVSGENFRLFMKNVPKDLARKYKIKDWHWQDKYGKPVGIKDSEWEARRRTWGPVQAPWATIEQAMSEPGRGFAIEIFDFGKFEDWIASHRSVQAELDGMIRKSITNDDPEYRLDTWAYLEARHDYVVEQRYIHDKYEPNDPTSRVIDENDVSDAQYQLAMLFDKNAHVPGSRANEMLVKTKDAMREYIIDFAANPYRIQGTINTIGN